MCPLGEYVEAEEWGKSNLHLSQAGAMYYMITSSNGNILRVTGHLCGEFNGDTG